MAGSYGAFVGAALGIVVGLTLIMTTRRSGRSVRDRCRMAAHQLAYWSSLVLCRIGKNRSIAVNRSIGILLYVIAIVITGLVVASKYFGVSIPTATALVMRDPTASLLGALALALISRWL